MSERLQKVLAQHGLGSRREIERWIADGRVTVNRQVAAIGAQYLPGDRVAIDGKEVTARLAIAVAPEALMYHKAQGQPIARADRQTDAEPEEEVLRDADVETVLERLPAVRGSRWVPINPMHAGDGGLLLLTNDGKLGYALTRRKRWIPSAYMVRVLAPGQAELPPSLPLQVTYDSGHGSETIDFTSVEADGGEGSNLWYRVEVPRADRRAAVRALFESRNLKVSRMTQIGFGPIELPRDLPRGRHRALTAEQLASLYALAELAVPRTTAIVAEPPHVRNRRGVAPDRRRAPKPHQRSIAKRSAAHNGKHDGRDDGDKKRIGNSAGKKSVGKRAGKTPRGRSGARFTSRSTGRGRR